jgi:hypothetical protein
MPRGQSLSPVMRGEQPVRVCLYPKGRPRLRCRLIGDGCGYLAVLMTSEAAAVENTE